MRTDFTHLKGFLEGELESRKRYQPSYSKRALARDLGISVTALTEFLGGKRELSYKNIDRVFEYLSKKVYCSWCDKPKKETKYLIGGPRRQFICDACIDQCVQLKRGSV